MLNLNVKVYSQEWVKMLVEYQILRNNSFDKIKINKLMEGTAQTDRQVSVA